MPENVMTPVNEFIARGVVLYIGRNYLKKRIIRIVVHGRRDTAYMECQIEGTLSRDIQVRDYVMVKGYTRAYSYHNDTLDKDSNVFYFVATDIQKDRTELFSRFGVVGGNFHAEQFFRAFVSGEVTEVSNIQENWAKITVKTAGGEGDQRPSFVVMSYPRASHTLPVFDYQKGDKICVRCSVHTPEKEFQGRKFRYQNLIVEDIAYLEKGPAHKEREASSPFPMEMPEKEKRVVRAKRVAPESEDRFIDDSSLMEVSD